MVFVEQGRATRPAERTKGIPVMIAAAPHPSAPAAKPARRWYAHLYVQVLAAIAAGVLLGHFYPATGEALKPVGDMFIKLVKMVIAPVIFLTIVTGIAGMRDLAAVGRVAAKAFAYFLFFSTLALVVGLIVGNVMRPAPGSTSIPPRSMPAKWPITPPRRTRARSWASSAR
jgi:aerobic C4-dicarboxylate transport protein